MLYSSSVNHIRKGRAHLDLSFFEELEAALRDSSDDFVERHAYLHTIESQLASQDAQVPIIVITPAKIDNIGFPDTVEEPLGLYELAVGVAYKLS